MLVANYYYAYCVGEALERALGQTYRHFEVVVRDDSSFDNSCAAIQVYVTRNQRIRLHRKGNRGVVSA